MYVKYFVLSRIFKLIKFVFILIFDINFLFELNFGLLDKNQ